MDIKQKAVHLNCVVRVGILISFMIILVVFVFAPGRKINKLYHDMLISWCKKKNKKQHITLLRSGLR